MVCPIIAPNYLATAEDRNVAVESIRLARRLMATDRLRAFKPQEVLPRIDITSGADLVKAAGRIATTIFYPVGTARMGRPDDKLAVVDPALRVRGIDNLLIADASVAPRIVPRNTHAPVVMIAERAAEMIMTG